MSRMVYMKHIQCLQSWQWCFIAANYIRQQIGKHMTRRDALSIQKIYMEKVWARSSAHLKPMNYFALPSLPVPLGLLPLSGVAHVVVASRFMFLQFTVLVSNSSSRLFILVISTLSCSSCSLLSRIALRFADSCWSFCVLVCPAGVRETVQSKEASDGIGSLPTTISQYSIYFKRKITEQFSYMAIYHTGMKKSSVVAHVFCTVYMPLGMKISKRPVHNARINFFKSSCHSALTYKVTSLLVDPGRYPEAR